MTQSIERLKASSNIQSHYNAMQEPTYRNDVDTHLRTFRIEQVLTRDMFESTQRAI